MRPPRRLTFAALTLASAVTISFAFAGPTEDLVESTTQLEADVAKVKTLAERVTSTKAQLDAMKAERDRAANKTALNEQIESVAAFLLELQRDLAKEARAARTQKEKTAKLALAAKSSKLKVDNKQIDAQMREARERADAAMAAAQTQLGMGVVAGALAIAPAAPVAGGSTRDAGALKKN